MGKIDLGLLARLRDHPDAAVRLIIRVRGDLPKAAAQLSARGLTVSRTLQLINAVAISGHARDAVALASLSWVQKVEEDRPVSIQR